jgi:hypothetical protein
MDFGATLYPLFLVCGLFGLIIAVGIGASYFWLLFLDARARTCPHCGQRGGGNIVESEIVDSRTYTEVRHSQGFSGAGVDASQLVRISEKTYIDHYECQACRHKWTKTAQEKKRDPGKAAKGHK